MGVDLTLMPLYSKAALFSHDVIRVERRRELWDDILVLPNKPMPQPFTCYLARLPSGEHGYGILDADAYGVTLYSVLAGDLSVLKNHGAVKDNALNLAVWAYLEQLPNDLPVVLYWH